MKTFEADLERLNKEHAAAVARVDAEYQREWLRMDQEYQALYNRFLAQQRKYEVEQRDYEEELRRWTTECEGRRLNEEALRQQLNNAVAKLENSLETYRARVNAEVPVLDEAKQRFDKARANELSEMKALHQKRRELQLQQFLETQLIQGASIDNIGDARKAALVAAGIDSAARIHARMRVPGFGEALKSYVLAWRQQCEARFLYNPNAPLPTGDVNRVKIKHAQARQSTLSVLRGGAAKLEGLESGMRGVETKARLDILALARAHAQAIADLTVC